MGQRNSQSFGKVGNSGGKKGRSGRRNSAATLLREEFLRQQENHAQDAFALHVQVMNDEKRRMDMRLAAAREIMRRVWGDKAETVVSGDVVIRVIREQRDINPAAHSASEAAANQE